MKNIVKNSVATLVALTLANTQLFASNSHCNASENVVFSCNTGKKVVSICASKAINAKSGYVQYKFGKLGTPEALIPAKPESFRQSVSAFYLNMGGSAEAKGIEFTNGNLLYGMNITNGYLYVRKNGSDVAEFSCKNDNLLIDNFDKYNFKKVGMKVEEE
jgi:hypothetical protein